MSYHIVKILFGTSGRNIVCNIDIPYNIDNFCFVPQFGYLFVLRDNHCISYVNLEGKVIISWLGLLDQKGYQEANGIHARLSYPSSVCYAPQTRKLFLIENGGSSLRVIDIDSAYISPLLGKSIMSKFEKIYAKAAIGEINTSCCVNKYEEVFWAVDKMHKCYRYKQGEVNDLVGNGRASYSVSSKVCNSSLNNPSGILIVNDKIYIADKGNHCIRELYRETIRLLEGTPIKTDVIDAPTCLKYHKGVFYFIDGNKIKYFSASNNDRGVVYESENIKGIDIDKDGLLILEKQNAKT